MKKFWYILFVTVFFLACLVPTVGMIWAGPSPAAANEVPAAKPRLVKFDGSVNVSYLSDVQTYLGSTFYLRLEGITGWDTLCAKLFHTSVNEDVLIGPDGWLFFGAAAGEISGADQLSDREIWCAARSLYLMQEYTESQGAQFLFTVPCGKYNLYPVHAPSYVTVADSSNRERLMPAMEALGINYVNMYDVFTQADQELYWQWDSHWTQMGAALAADALLAETGRDTNYYDGPFIVYVDTHVGDLYEMLYPKGTAREADYIWNDFTFTYLSSFHDYDDVTIETENSSAEGSLLMFRDSSGRSLYPYMAQSYGRALFSRLNNYRLDFIAQQEADTVIVELAERTIPYLLQYPAVYPAPVRDSAVLDEAVPAESAVEADDSGRTMENYVKLSGTLPETAIDAAVYVTVDGTVYEAIPGEGSFTAWLPMDSDWQNAQVYVGA